MADPSRTTWPDWAPRPVLCSVCGLRVTLKQAHRSLYAAGVGTVWHTACDRVRVRIEVTAAA